MINQEYWKTVASKWATKSDGIDIPDIGPIDSDLGLDDEEFDGITDELDDILADIEI